MPPRKRIASAGASAASAKRPAPNSVRRETSLSSEPSTSDASDSEFASDGSSSSPATYFTAESGSDTANEAIDDHGRPMVIRVRLARIMMPYRWRDPLPPFASVLTQRNALKQATTEPSGLDPVMVSVLTRALSCDELVKDDSWLGSSFIDLVLSRFAREYPEVHFMPIEFAAFRLKTMKTSDMRQATDILGRPINYELEKPVVFLANVANMHWNLLRVQHWPLKELQLFEPLGKPPQRAASMASKRPLGSMGSGRGRGGGGERGVSMRYIPQHITHWLDTCWPLDRIYERRGPSQLPPAALGPHGLAASASSTISAASSASRPSRRRGRPGPLDAPASQAKFEASKGGKGGRAGAGNGLPSWQAKGLSAITTQHQMTGFDCGVACLLYAEKCGQGMMREDINAGTSQQDFTKFRHALQERIRELDVPEGD